MDRSKWFFHPIFIFVVSILALGTSLILYIYWYIEASEGLNKVVNRFNLPSGQILTAQTWVVILVLSILVGTILLGMFIIFAYSQKMVQLYRLQRNFINNFTHELKTPVASLSLYLETFQKYELDRENQLKYIGYMLLDVKRLSDNVSRILDLARIEGKGYAAEFIWLDPLKLIERFLIKNRHLFVNCRINVLNNLKQPLLLRMNSSLFEMLMMNLMTNAIKYNTSETPTIKIFLRQKTGRLQILFKDNGIGFQKSERRKIFKKFYQIGSSDDMTAKGSGIGLFLAQSIAKIHRGRISAYSKGPDQGAVFILILPLLKKG
ncbi:MAG: HAMP domain-containing histidine kinase [Desulfobacteraceae bacterium]|nr:HAMP domain-containing histidine kinase [Desulfobacteraceae bacterium]